MNATKIICITPIKNEAWILNTFLKCASIWADNIILADQNSTDESLNIAAQFPKVQVIPNNSIIFNEPERQKFLIDAARKIPCEKRILIALDADEILGGDLSFFRSKEFLQQKQGTIFTFSWYNIARDSTKYWSPPIRFPFGFVDDGSEHNGRQIHSTRIPTPNSSERVHLLQNPIFHLQYIDWNRMQSKHRWYESYERLNFPQKNPIDIYRMYHHMYSIRTNEFKTLDHKYLESYQVLGINPFSHEKSQHYYWDLDVLKLIFEHGSSKFRKIDIWNFPWASISNELGYKNHPKDPRTFFDRAISAYLSKTQAIYPNRLICKIDSILKKFYY